MEVIMLQNTLLMKNRFLVKHLRYKSNGNNSYTMHTPKKNQQELIQKKNYKMIFIMRGVDDSIGKQLGRGIWRENGQSQKLSILKDSWSFIESEKNINNANSLNFFLRLNGQSANHAISEEINVAAFYFKEIGTLNKFNDVRITNVKDPNDENDVGTRKYVDN